MLQHCGHEKTIRTVTPGSLGCRECLEIGQEWVHLRLCRECGDFGMAESDLPIFAFTEIDPLLVPRTNPIDLVL